MLECTMLMLEVVDAGLFPIGHKAMIRVGIKMARKVGLGEDGEVRVAQLDAPFIIRVCDE